ncbi:BatD family protein [Algicella marina]|uniref:Protein BatD n=1 Tax=Algicella marina TaxID=2683284 RepID=A0A6P1T231_9RHOB|nr:BatD family protein [Algicella marina]QHQ35359.1 hypothetical protein GO499_09200 [Algicella marina]
MVRLLALLFALAGPLAAQDRDTLHLELVLDPRAEAPLESEMILATIRGVYRETITNEELKLRSMTDFDWTRLGQDDWTDQQVDGRTARVFERRIAFYPKRAGTLEILPIVHELQVLDAEGQRETVLVRSAPVKIEVGEKPVNAGEKWFPVRALELSDTWETDAGKLEDGQNVERRVVLRALGATPEMMPQQPPLREPWLITFAPPAEQNFQVTSQGPVTTLVWTWRLRPITGEPGVIPPVTIPYFDTSIRESRTATIPAAPIGYASFSDNAASGWRKDLGVDWPLLATFVLTLILGLTPTLKGRTGFPVVLGRLRRKFQTRQKLRRLRRHADDGDAVRFRALAQSLIRTRSGTRPFEVHPVLQPVDAMLFGGKEFHESVDLRVVFREVRRHVYSSENVAGSRSSGIAA